MFISLTVKAVMSQLITAHKIMTLQSIPFGNGVIRRNKVEESWSTLGENHQLAYGQYMATAPLGFQSFNPKVESERIHPKIKLIFI